MKNLTQQTPDHVIAPDFDPSDVVVENYEDMTREELIACCHAHDAHHAEHHAKEDAAAPPSPAQSGVEQWRGIAKLIEEQGEVLQLLGKLIAYPVGEHPDGQGNLKDRLHDELADLQAAAEYFIQENNFNEIRIGVRSYSKFRQFKKWALSGICLLVDEKAGGS